MTLQKGNVPLNSMGGIAKHPLYYIFDAMFARCYDPGNSSYKNYGGRGITICDRWKQQRPIGFWNFVQDMGPRPEGYTLERKNNDLGYSPDNCKWAT